LALCSLGGGGAGVEYGAKGMLRSVHDPAVSFSFRRIISVWAIEDETEQQCLRWLEMFGSPVGIVRLM